jgi:hypothetical protein
MLAPIEPTPDTDIDSFIMNETQNALLNIIEESRVDVSTVGLYIILMSKNNRKAIT